MTTNPATTRPATKAELLAIAQDEGITVRPSWTRPRLIEAIRQHTLSNAAAKARPSSSITGEHGPILSDPDTLAAAAADAVRVMVSYCDPATYDQWFGDASEDDQLILFERFANLNRPRAGSKAHRIGRVCLTAEAPHGQPSGYLAGVPALVTLLLPPGDKRRRDDGRTDGRSGKCVSMLIGPNTYTRDDGTDAPSDFAGMVYAVKYHATLDDARDFTETARNAVWEANAPARQIAREVERERLALERVERDADAGDYDTPF